MRHRVGSEFTSVSPTERDDYIPGCYTEARLLLLWWHEGIEFYLRIIAYWASAAVPSVGTSRLGSSGWRACVA